MVKKEGSIIQRVLGLNPEEVLQAANSLTVDDIRKLVYRLEVIADDLKRNVNSDVMEGNLPPSLAGVKDSYNSRVRNNMAMLQGGKISKSVFLKDMQDAVSSSFTDSYQLGKGAKILTAGDELWVQRATAQEVGYISDLADRLADPDEPEIDIDFRSNNYSQTLDSVAWNGKIESLSNDTEIRWKLGCLTSNLVRVETARGKIPLYQVNIGDLVLTHKGNWKKVIAKPLTPVSKDHRFAVLVGEDGRLVGLTDDHKLWTDEGWLNAKDVFYRKKKCEFTEGNLSILRKIFCEGNKQDQEIEIGRVFLFNKMFEQKWLYDLTVEDDHSFIVEGMPVHNSAEHCEDCILLASQSPFNKDSLPTTPKAGSTDCHTNCRCTLVFKKGQLKPEDALDPSDRERIQGQTLNDFLSPKAPPRGLRIPTDIERGEIDTITAEMNYYRRLIGSGELQGEALKDAIKSRSSLNASLIDYTEERGIWDSPLLSVDDVITEAKFPLSAESELFLNYGVDGATLDLTTSIKIEKLIGEFEKDYGKEFTDTKKEYKKPEVKSKDKKKKKTK